MAGSQLSNRIAHAAFSVAVIAVSLLTLPLILRSPAPGPREPWSDDIQGLVEQLESTVPRMLARSGTPGAAIAVVHEGRLEWVQAFGVADRRSGHPLSPDAVFQVGSVSKLVASLGVMRLVEQGALDLDAPVETYLSRWRLPPSPFGTTGVTPRTILSHTAGLSLHGYPGYDPQVCLPTLEQSLAGHGLPPTPVEVIQPSGRFRYSGGGYTLLELALEEVSGVDFAELMRDALLAPLGMENSSFTWETRLRPETATGHGPHLEPLPDYRYAERAAAGFSTTVSDLARLAVAQLNSYIGNGFFSAASMDELLRPVARVGGRSRAIGLGHFLEYTDDGSLIVSHDGANRGWRAAYTLVPESGAALIILTNGDNGQAVISEVQSLWRRRFASW